MTISLFPALPTTTALAASALEVDGAVMNPGAIVGAIQAIMNNGASRAGHADNFNTSAAATITLSSLAGLQQFLSNGGAVTVTLDNAPNVISNIAGPFNGMTFPMFIACAAATTVAAPTVTNTGITLAGTTTVAASSGRWYKGQITQLTSQAVTGVTAASAFTSIAQIGTTNLYTLTITVNAIAQIVGNLIWLGVTAGTLPAGFYPTYTTGTTTIVIALPPSGTAWTATAATLTNAPTVVPVTLAPPLTLTGMFAAATFIA